MLTASGDEAKSATEMALKKKAEMDHLLHTSSMQELEARAKILEDEIETIADELIASG